MGSSFSTTSSSDSAEKPEIPVSAPPHRADTEREGYLANDNQHIKNLMEAARQKLKEYSQGHDGRVSLCRYALKEVPAELLMLDNVKSIDLSFNRIDTLSDEFFDKFASTLEELVVTSTWLQKTKMTNLSKLVHLRHLDLSWSWLSHLDWLNSLTCLEYLSIKHGKYQGKLNLTALKSLRHLDASENELTDFPELHLGGCLSFIDVSYNTLSNIPSSISQMLELEKMNISFNRTLTEVPGSLAKLPKLRMLDMGGVVVSSLPSEWSEAGAFPCLDALSIQLTKFTEFPTLLFSLVSLKKLEVSNNKISSVPAGLSSLSNLESLSLRYNDLKDLPGDLFSLPKLTWLELCGNDLTSLSPRISELSKLTYLDVSFNHIPSLPKELGNLKSLIHLHFYGNPMSDKSLEELATTSRTAAPVLAHLSGNPRSDFVTDFDDVFDELPVVKLPFKVQPVASLPQGCTSLSSSQLRDKIYGTILGNAIGDAMGICTEFMRANEAACRYGFRYLEYSDIVSDRHRGRFRRGDFTDDTDQMLLILNNLLRNGLKPNISEFADDLLRWANTGAAEFGDNVGWGIGATVSAVLETSYFLQDPHKAARDMWEKAKRGPAANGAVMRTSVLGIPFFWDPSMVTAQTLEFCLVTHADPRCQASCIATTLAIASILRGRSDVPAIVDECHQAGLKCIEKDSEKEEFSNHISKFSLAQLELGDSPKIGYTLKTAGSAFWALRHADLGFKVAMMRIFQQGGDSDTNGAVAGAVLGCLLGFSKIPKSWVDKLIHKDYLLERAEHLCQLLGI